MSCSSGCWCQGAAGTGLHQDWDSLCADSDPSTGSTLTNQGTVLQHLSWMGRAGCGWQGPNNSSTQSEVMNQVWSSSRWSDQEQNKGLEMIQVNQ